MDNYFLKNHKIRNLFPTKVFVKNVYKKHFAKKLAAISCNFFFHNKVYKYFLQKKVSKHNW